MAQGIVSYIPGMQDNSPAEMKTRDARAEMYLRLPKFPTQISRLRRFIRGIARGGPVLDLACGPGPMTKILLESGFDVIGADFSARSLVVNKASCRSFANRSAFVQADLTALQFTPGASAGLVMLDFLQLLPSMEARAEFLAKAFVALKPGGWFMLSFANINIVNRLKGDIQGSYAEGTIRYTRLSLQQVKQMLPPGMVVTDITPTNIFNGVLLDRLSAALPFSHRLARMIMLGGYKAS